MKEGDFINKLYLLSLIRKYGVNVVEYDIGLITISIATWNQYQDLFHDLMNESLNEPFIYSIKHNNGLVTIHYDESFLNDPFAIERLFILIEKYRL